jgi:hypothetical protein
MQCGQACSWAGGVSNGALHLSQVREAALKEASTRPSRLDSESNSSPYKDGAGIALHVCIQY